MAELARATLPRLDRLVRQVDARVRHPVNSVTPGATAGEDEHVLIGAHPVPDNLGFLPEADAPHVDDDVAEIPLVEDDASGDGRDPDAIPVIADSRDDPAEEVFRMLRPPRQFLVGMSRGPK